MLQSTQCTERRRGPCGKNPFWWHEKKTMQSHRTQFVFWEATVNSGIHWALHIVNMFFCDFLCFYWGIGLNYSFSFKTRLQLVSRIKKLTLKFFAGNVITQYWSVEDPDNIRQSVQLIKASKLNPWRCSIITFIRII